MKLLVSLLKRLSVPFAVLCLFLTVSQITGIACPIRYFTGVPCPTCGVTRAVVSLLRLDLAGYWEYNPMAAFLIIAVLLFLCADLFPKIWKRVSYSAAALILAVNTVYYIAKLLVYFS